MRIISILIIYSCSALLFAASTVDTVRKYYPIKYGDSVDEYIVQKAALSVTPIGTRKKSVFSILKSRGLGVNNYCYPDRAPLVCDFRNLEKEGRNRPNYTVEYSFDSEDKLKNIGVTRWYYGRVKSYTTEARKPGIPIGVQLKGKLRLGSTVADFEKVYGGWEISGMGEPGWPLVLIFNSDSKAFAVGVDIGDVSRYEFLELKEDKEVLRKQKIGVVF